MLRNPASPPNQRRRQRRSVLPARVVDSEAVAAAVDLVVAVLAEALVAAAVVAVDVVRAAVGPAEIPKVAMKAAMS